TAGRSCAGVRRPSGSRRRAAQDSSGQVRRPRRWPVAVTRPRVLVARLDSAGDVLLAGPAIRALAADADVDVLASHIGAPAARLLPDVEEVSVFDAPWVLHDPPELDAARLAELVAVVAAAGYRAAAILTSSHQSPLPLALLLRLAEVPE